MQRVYGIALPALLLAGATPQPALPTLPTLTAPAPSSGIVADHDGTIYFVDTFHTTIWRARAGEGLNAHVVGRSSRSLVLDDNGSLHGVHDDPRRGSIAWRADAAGHLVELGRAPQRDARLPANVVLAAGRDGAVYFVVGSVVRRLDADGTITTLAADQPLLRPRQSLLTRLFGETQNHLSGLAVACNGDVVVTNVARGVVLRISDDGRITQVHASEAGWRPTGVAAADGMLYVLEYGRGVRVQRISGDGQSSVLAVVRTARAVAHEVLTARFSTVL